MFERTYLACLAAQGVVDKKKSKKKKKKKSKDPANHMPIIYFWSERLCVLLWKQSSGPRLVGELWKLGDALGSRILEMVPGIMTSYTKNFGPLEVL